jgi:CRP-like cAMP-binding protein
MEKDKVLFQENDDGKYFYIVKSGVLELLIKKERKKLFNEWDCFGELALMQKCKRTGTVKCLTDVELLVLEGQLFRDIVKSLTSSKLKENILFIDMIPMVKSLDNIQKTNLAKLITLKEFQDAEKIIKEGDVGDGFYIVKDGCVSCQTKGKEIRKLYANDFFGHNSILIECRRSLDVVAVGKVFCYEFSKATLKEALGETYKEIILFSIFKECVLSNKFFSEIFNEAQVEKIFELFEMKIYKDQDVIYMNNSKTKKIVILIEGNIVKVLFYF